MERLFKNQAHSKSFLILDGGSGTTLADQFSCQLTSHLWSSKLLIDQPEILSNLYRAWERAGANIISTTSYQATLQGFSTILSSSSHRATDDSCLELLRSSVSLVRDALAQKDTRVALSLGPYGATLMPGQEYTGCYPAPYDTQDKLCEFHFDRLMHYAKDRSTWDQLDIVLFETIPNLVEARAIRQAWKKLQDSLELMRHDELSASPERIVKPWIMSFVFPGLEGRFPTGESPIEVLKAALEPQIEGALPSGIGINCSQVDNLAPILQVWSSSELLKPLLWLWLYPDGGPTYDSINRCWLGSSITPQEWARKLVMTATSFSSSWAGLVVGGCCKAGTQHIEELHKFQDPRTNSQI